MTNVDYARVSTDDQTLALQRDALQAAGCEIIHEDRPPGRRRCAGWPFARPTGRARMRLFTRYRLEEVRKRKLGYLLTDHVRMLVGRPGVDAAPDTGVAHLLRHLREAPPPPRHSHWGIGVTRIHRVGLEEQAQKSGR